MTRKLTTCNSEVEAYILKGRLETEGIPSVVGNAIMSGYPPMSGVTLFVNEEDYDRAREIMNSNDEIEQ